MNRIMKLLLIVIAIIYMSSVSYAFDSEKEHADFMQNILLDKSILLNTEQNTVIECLNAATSLAMDQFGSKENGSNQLQKLKKYNVPDLPDDLEEIAFSCSPTEHRQYTHKGWNYHYPDDRAHWPIRKEIIQNTVRKTFDFQDSILFKSKDNAKCDKFSALIYYVHILGDYKESLDKAIAKSDEAASSKIGELNSLIPFYSNNEECSISEICECITTLCPDSKKGAKYLSDQLALGARGIQSCYRTMNNKKILNRASSYTHTDIMEYKLNVDNFIKLLENGLPELLQKENFFTDVFYTEDSDDSWYDAIIDFFKAA